ncbi:MAG TPA: copper-binding protein [Candidatus Binatia bacterium]|nr:copper-binding protein [Candidatus Binatia bacterium]
MRPVHLAADAVHRLATGTWLGGLVPLAVLLVQARGSAESPARVVVVGTAVRRFSTFALVCVVALVAGVLIGYSLSAGDLGRPATSPGAPPGAPAGARSWTVKGIVRGTLPSEKLVVITHEPIPGLMGAMTMAFRVEAADMLEGLTAGDVIEFRLEERGQERLIRALRKEREG